MKSLLRLLIGICLLQRGPQDLPHSVAITRGLVLLGIGINLFFVRLVDAGDSGLAQIALSLVLLLALPWLLLNARGRQARYAQTLAAFAGTGVLFTLAVLPLAMQTADLPQPQADVAPTREQLVMMWLTLLLLCWKLTIDAHIWKHALDWPRAGGMLLAVGVFLLEAGLMRGLIGSAAP